MRTLLFDSSSYGATVDDDTIRAALGAGIEEKKTWVRLRRSPYTGLITIALLLGVMTFVSLFGYTMASARGAASPGADRGPRRKPGRFTARGPANFIAGVLGLSRSAFGWTAATSAEKRRAPDCDGVKPLSRQRAT